MKRILLDINASKTKDVPLSGKCRTGEAEIPYPAMTRLTKKAPERFNFSVPGLWNRQDPYLWSANLMAVAHRRGTHFLKLGKELTGFPPPAVVSSFFHDVRIKLISLYGKSTQ